MIKATNEVVLQNDTSIPAGIILTLLVGCIMLLTAQFSFASTPTALKQAHGVISIDYCADQFVMKLLDPENILAVSMDAGKAFSYMRADAANYAQVRPLAEDVLLLQPELVVRSYGGGPNAQAFFSKAGMKVLQLAYTNSVADVQNSILAVSNALGVSERGEAIVADMNQRLQRIADQQAETTTKPTVLYITPGGVTAGPGTLIHEMIELAGLKNFQTAPGWRSIPLEKLAFETPNIVATAFYQYREDKALSNHFNSWSPSSHPLVTEKFKSLPLAQMEGATTACGGWFLLDAIEVMAQQGLDNAGSQQ